MACVISCFYPKNNEIIKSITVDESYLDSEIRAKALNDKLSEKPNKKELYWKVTIINA
jgi:hypothetical protein